MWFAGQSSAQVVCMHSSVSVVILIVASNFLASGPGGCGGVGGGVGDGTGGGVGGGVGLGGGTGGGVGGGTGGGGGLTVPPDPDVGSMFRLILLILPNHIPEPRSLVL
jgi:hypothetical protein